MIGEKFGKWTVLEYRGTNKRQAKLYLCRCECGSERVIVGSYLNIGETKSCKLCMNIKQLNIGDKFGNWTTIKHMGTIKGTTSYLCRCSCGNEKVFPASYLRTARKSKGCRECTRKYKDIAPGRRFGKLVVIAQEKSNRGSYYICKCDCNNEIALSASRLMRENPKKCWNCHVAYLSGYQVEKL